MNKIAKWGLAGAVACTIAGVRAQQINPMTEAVLRDYAEILAENPKDYLTLYDRASQYMEMGDFARALSDIEMALEYTPAEDKDYRLAEYSLKSDILTAMKDYQGAMEAVKSALAINPTSVSDLYKSGNLNLITDNPEGALRAFESLQRENPRSQEAFYGMAKANALMGNYDEAEKLVKEVESLGKQSYVTYCRIGDLYADMGNTKEAVTNYAIAFSMEDHSNRPVESLKMLARKNKTMVMETINGLAAANSDNMSLNYLKAILAFDGGMYAAAEKACKELAGALEEDSPAVYRMMAMSQLAQNKTDEAKQSISTAQMLAPGDIAVMLDKSEILMGEDPVGAFEAASKAVVLAPEDEAVLLTAAKSAILAGKYTEAQEFLNSIVLGNPANVEALLLRGYLNSEYLNDGKAGVADYTRAGNVQTGGKVRETVLAAIGKAKTNKKLDADGMINDAVSKAGNNKDDLYIIAVYYAQTGNLEKAKEYADKAMINGYSNLYNLQRNNTPLLNLQPIRHLLGS